MPLLSCNTKFNLYKYTKRYAVAARHFGPTHIEAHK